MNFEQILKKAEEQLVFESGQFDQRSDTDAIYALAKYATDESLRPQVIKFIENAFDSLRKDTEKERFLGDAGLVNQMIFGAVGRLAGMIGEKSLAPLIYKEFQFAVSDEQHYEMNMEGGTLAIALSLLDYGGDTNAFDDFLKNYEWRYKGEEFVLEVRYAYWLIKGDKLGPVEYLKMDDEESKKSLGLVAASLADLDAKEGLPTLKELLPKIKNPVTTEAFIEAVSRLEKQTNPPEPKDRMIWLFGKYSGSEIARGQDSDNEFVKRAQKKTKNNDLGMVYEVDESAKEDL